MKKIIYIIAVTALAFQFTACKKSLEIAPKDQFSDETVWNSADPGLVQAFINNIYLGVPHGFSNIMMSSLVDESMYNADFGTSNVTKSLITPSDLSIFDPGYWTGLRQRTIQWSNAYRFVRACNLFFTNIDKSPIEESVKNKMKGEVYFLRAYIYHNLVSTYGGVPIITKAYTLNDEFLVTRDSFEDCIKFIVEDCDAAAANLSLTPETGRASKGAALSLKSRVLLHAASDLFNNPASWSGGFGKPELIGYVGGNRQERWQAAKNAAKAVIDLNAYSLYMPNPASAEEAQKNYEDIFLKHETSEDIFARYFTTKVDQNWDGYNPGLYNHPNGYHGWGSNTPIGQMVDDYEMADGSAFSWSNNAHATSPYTNREPRFYASILYEGAKWRPRPTDAASKDPVGIIQVGYWEKWNPATNSVVLVPGIDTRNSPFEDWNGTYTGYYLKKFIDPTIDAQYNKQTQPWRYIRYTEILLNYAEACIALGEENEAKTYINMIRRRAFMPEVTESGNALLQKYRHERRIELAFEDHRYYDVRRWMIAPSAYTDAKGVDVRYKLNPDNTTSVKPTYTVKTVQQRAWNPRFYFLPISIDELNRNNTLQQNPLY